MSQAKEVTLVYFCVLVGMGGEGEPKKETCH